MLLRIVFVVLFMSCSSFGQFYFGTCSGYSGTTPIVGKFMGSFKPTENVPISLYGSQSGSYGVNVFKLSKSNTYEFVKYVYIVFGNSNPNDTDIGTYMDEGFYYTDKGTTFSITKNVGVDSIFKTDTVRVIDTIKIRFTDTVSVLKTDTIQLMDTLWFRDTIKTTDTLFIPDTIHNYVHDTVSVCEYNKSVIWQQRLYRSKGVSEQKQAITLETEPGSSPSVEFETSEKVHANVYIYDNLGTYVTSGRFEILPSNHKQYLKFNGLSKYGSRVVDGVFLMRVITHHNGNTTNTIYNVGISNK